MITQEQLKEKINRADWDSLEKERALAIIPQLGRNSLEFLYSTVGIQYSRLVIGGIMDAFSIFILGFQNYFSGKSREILEMLSQATDTQKWDYGHYILPLVLDNRQLVRMGKIQDKDLILSLRAFILAFYDQLPEEEINYIYQSELLFFLSQIRVLDELKLLAYIKDENDLPLWTGQFLQSLQKNEEKIGIKDVVTNGQIHPPTIGNWIFDFLTTSPGAAQGEPTLAQVDYLHKSINVKNLTDKDREILTEVLKLYCWCLQPEINEKEIQEYQSLKENVEEDEEISVLPHINIDEKLVELKDRKEKVSF